jgi:hypothetical protein
MSGWGDVSSIPDNTLGGMGLECCPGTDIRYPAPGSDTECPVCHTVFTVSAADPE